MIRYIVSKLQSGSRDAGEEGGDCRDVDESGCISFHFVREEFR